MKLRILSAARLSIALASAIAALLAVPSVHAATLYWDSNGTGSAGSGAATGTWGADVYWTTDSTGANVGAPVLTAATSNADDLFFSAGSNGSTGTVTIDTTQAAHSITFDDPVVLTLSGGTAINLGSATAGSGLFFTGNAANVISTPVILNSLATAIAITNSTASLQTLGDITGDAASGTQTLTVGSSSTGGIMLGGIIGNGGGSGVVALTVNSRGSGVTTLTGANTYTGATTINAGTLQIGNGTTGSLTGTALTFGGTGTFNVNETAGSTQGMGLLTLSSGQATIQSTFASTSATLTFSDVAARTAGASANFVTSGGINGDTNKIVLTQLGGVATPTTTLLDKGIFFGGNSYATYDTLGFLRGFTTGDTNYLAAPAGTTLGSPTISSNVAVTGAISAQAAAIANTINMGANNITMSGTSLVLQTNGLLSNGSSSATLGGGTTPRLQPATAGGELVVRVNGGTDVLTISSIIQNNTSASSFTKTGAGTLNLTGANTFNGGIYVNSGTVNISTVGSSAAHDSLE